MKDEEVCFALDPVLTPGGPRGPQRFAEASGDPRKPPEAPRGPKSVESVQKPPPSIIEGRGRNLAVIFDPAPDPDLQRSPEVPGRHGRSPQAWVRGGPRKPEIGRERPKTAPLDRRGPRPKPSRKRRRGGGGGGGKEDQRKAGMHISDAAIHPPVP